MIETQDFLALGGLIGIPVVIGGITVLIKRIAQRQRAAKSQPTLSLYDSIRPKTSRTALRRPRVNMRKLYIWILLVFVTTGLTWAATHYLRFIPGALTDITLNLATHAGNDAHDKVRSYAYAFGALAASLAFLFTIPFQFVRIWLNERNTFSNEQGHITDRINKAVEGLGAEKTVRHMKRKPNGERYSLELTVPNIEVRIGAIYSLERIAQDSERDHIQIMEILCAYIRENAPARDAQPNPLPDWPKYPDDPTAEDLRAHYAELGKHRQRLHNWVAKLRHDHKPRADIQTALSVLGRRDPSRIDGIEFKKYRGDDRYRLDLRYCNLQAADLAHLDFRFARIEETQLQGADLTGAKLQGADLTEAKLQGAFLTEAKLQGADLRWAKLQGADLTGAKLQGAFLTEAKLQGAFLTEAELQGADLRWAKLQGAFLTEAELQGADLTEAKLQRAGLRWAELQGAGLRWADLRSVKWAGLHILPIFAAASI